MLEKKLQDPKYSVAGHESLSEHTPPSVHDVVNETGHAL
jgi:hypothetical protein